MSAKLHDGLDNAADLRRLLGQGKQIARCDHRDRKLTEIVVVKRQQMRDAMGKHHRHQPGVMHTPTNHLKCRDQRHPMPEHIRRLIEERELRLKPINFLARHLDRPTQTIRCYGAGRN